MKKLSTLILMSLALFLLGCDVTDYTNARTYDEGYEAGSKTGYRDGLNDGAANGYSEGYKEGYDEGYSNGYDDGYKDGYSDGSAEELSIPESKASSSNSLSYIGNKNTKKFHKSTCSSVNDIKESNKVYESQDYFIEHGYDPCKKCNP